jgi:hypothetical protein
MAFDASPIVQFGLRQLSQSLAPILFLSYSTSSSSPWSGWLLAWLVAPIVPFLIASQRRFLFLGEAERYLEYAVVPAAVITSLVVLQQPVFVGALLLFVWLGAAAAAIFYQWLRVQWLERSSLAPLVEYLETVPAVERVLPIPSVNLAFELAWRSRHDFLVAMDTLVWTRDYDRLFITPHSSSSRSSGSSLRAAAIGATCSTIW